MSEVGNKSKQILSLYQSLPKPVEVELRINLPISTTSFYRLLNSLPPDQVTISETIVNNYKNDIRSIQSGSSITWEKKTKSTPFDFKNYGFRIGLSSEIATVPVNETPIFTRRKKTFQYTLDGFRYDLTEVDGKYEIEIEFVGKTFDSKALADLITLGIQVVMILDDTEIFMLVDEKVLVTERFNEIMGVKGTFLKKVFNKPVDLHFNDLTADVLLKNPYSITAKADGLRKLILGLNSGIYFVTFQGISKVADKNHIGKDFLIDGELIENQFYLFDVLFYDRTFLVDENLTRRLSYRKFFNRINIVQNGEALVLNVVSKNFVFFKTAEEFFQGISTIMNETKFVIDGLVFTPVNSGYFGKIFKWKPSEKLTIDFQIIDSNTIGVKNSANQIVPFQTNDKIVIGPDFQAGDIVEFAHQPGKWITMRLRDDKVEPNFERVAYDIVKMIENPIQLETLMGKDLVLMRKYHNRVKSQLYNFLREKNVVTVVDLGAGRGGDVQKWKSGGFKVTAVEPNKENLAELEKRVKEAGMKVKIVNTTAEEFTCREKVDAVTMFHSLTFFYDKTEHVELLLSNIDSCVKNGGYVVIMAVDGKKLRENFPTGKEGNLIKIKYVQGGLIINLENTIVNQQHEFLTDFSDLISRFEQRGYNIVQNFFLDDETFLTLEGRLYSQSTHVLIVNKTEQLILPNYPSLKVPEPREVDLTAPTRIVKRKLARLGPDEAMTIKTWTLIGAIADTSTLLHAILGAFSSTYIEMDLVDRKEFVLALRRQVGGKMSDATYSLGADTLETWMKLFGINIYLTELNTTDFITTYDYQEGLPSVYIYWNDIDDFATMGIAKDDLVQTYFE